MEPELVHKDYDRVNFKENPLVKAEYENCKFISCHFESTDLSEIKFICQFRGSNVSLVNLSKTVFRESQFVNCKMLGLQFYNCSEFGLSFTFDNCNLGHSSFYKTKIKKTVFRNSQLHEVDFTECDLSGSSFEQCDLANARFENTIMEKGL